MEGLFTAPQVSKSLIERLKGVKGISDLMTALKDSWNDTILEREDEDEMGQRDDETKEAWKKRREEKKEKRKEAREKRKEEWKRKPGETEEE
jgi:hypothetical protein